MRLRQRGELRHGPFYNTAQLGDERLEVHSMAMSVDVQGLGSRNVYESVYRETVSMLRLSIRVHSMATNDDS